METQNNNVNNLETVGTLEKLKAFTLNDKRSKIVGILSVVGILLLTFFIQSVVTKYFVTKVPSSNTISFFPKKTEFQNVPPTDFPKEIPLEKNSKLTTSYLKEYENFLERSVAFSSEKPVSENIIFYRNILKQQQWKIVEDKQLKGQYFLSAKKDINIINISIFDISSKVVTNASTTTATSSEFFSKIKSNVAIRITNEIK